jgi:hypothetical protein
MSAINELKQCLKKYQRVDNELRDINAKTYELRETRRCLEDEMSHIVTLPEFSTIDKLKLEDDGSVIQIVKPGANKPWGLSKKDLHSHLESFFASRLNSNAESCYEYIVAEQSKKLVTTEYSFNRIVKQQ